MRRLFVLIIIIGMEGTSYAAHTLEPLGTEIGATPPRGRFFFQGVYTFLRTENEEKINEHLLPLEIEFGLSERTQLNLEGEVLIAEEEDGKVEERGIEEIAVGIKHRFFDETKTLPDMAFEIEFAPVIELGDGLAIGGTLMFSKFLGRWFVLHINTGYEFEREEEKAEHGEEAEDEMEVAKEEGDETEITNVFFYNLALMLRVIPDKFLLLAELNAEHRFVEDGPTIDEVVVVPEFIAVPFEKPLLALKLGVPIGLTDSSSTPDIGISAGISWLF